MSEQFRGVDGELFENLMRAANLPNGNDWLETTSYIAHLIGGSRLDRVTPDSREPPPAGSVAEDRRASHEVVRREDYVRLIVERLNELADGGLYEPFLARALRDAVTRWVDGLADSATVKAKREQHQADMLESIEDPEMIRRLRERLAKNDPRFADMSDEEIAEEYRALAEKLGPRSVDDEVAVWSIAESWNTRSAELISDAAIQRWTDRWLANNA